MAERRQPCAYESCLDEFGSGPLTDVIGKPLEFGPRWENEREFVSGRGQVRIVVEDVCTDSSHRVSNRYEHATGSRDVR